MSFCYHLIGSNRWQGDDNIIGEMKMRCKLAAGKREEVYPEKKYHFGVLLLNGRGN